jgi:hypothetical protein
LAEKKFRQEEILRQEQEKLDRKIKKKMLEERWTMMKWVTTYIDENADKWARDKKERQENEQKWQEEWARMTRFEKIRNIREKTGLETKDLMSKIIPQLKPSKLNLEQKCSGDNRAETCQPRR